MSQSSIPLAKPNSVALQQLLEVSPENRKKLQQDLEARIARLTARRSIDRYYPDTGPLRRELYSKHIEFFNAGAIHQERAFIAANRSGKTHAACYELTCHLTGIYPNWWQGRRFDEPITAWACGEDGKAVRESIQEKLLGRLETLGHGLIPADLIREPKARAGIPDAIDFLNVKHITGGLSRLSFKSYDQRRESFQGSAVDVVLLDEEPDLGIYTEALTRTLSTVPGKPNGIMMCSFTPLRGLSETVLQFLPGGTLPTTVEQRMKAWGWLWLFSLLVPQLFTFLGVITGHG